jgi:hypothetical protein
MEEVSNLDNTGIKISIISIMHEKGLMNNSL